MHGEPKAPSTANLGDPLEWVKVCGTSGRAAVVVKVKEFPCQRPVFIRELGTLLRVPAVELKASRLSIECCSLNKLFLV